jgi:hypothetical protein
MRFEDACLASSDQRREGVLRLREDFFGSVARVLRMCSASISQKAVA